MPVWQALYSELSGEGLTIITVALDKSAEDARPWIEAAAPTHPSLIDTNHSVADLFGMVNVPTAVWIDESGRIVRPNDVAFGTDRFKRFHGIDPEQHQAALRAWVHGELDPPSPATLKSGQKPPTLEMQLARAEFGLGRWLYENGRASAAATHLRRAGELAPNDFTIRRGSMPMLGIDPFGPEFVEMTGAWADAGHSYYLPLSEPAEPSDLE